MKSRHDVVAVFLTFGNTTFQRESGESFEAVVTSVPGMN